MFQSISTFLNYVAIGFLDIDLRAFLNISQLSDLLLYPLAFIPAKSCWPHLIDPAGSTHVYFQISRIYDSSTDDRQPHETWCMQREMIQGQVQLGDMNKMY
jgi:hypothetical protein